MSKARQFKRRHKKTKNSLCDGGMRGATLCSKCGKIVEIVNTIEGECDECYSKHARGIE